MYAHRVIIAQYNIHDTPTIKSTARRSHERKCVGESWRYRPRNENETERTAHRHECAWGPGTAGRGTGRFYCSRTSTHASAADTNSSRRRRPTAGRMDSWCESRPASAQIAWRKRHGPATAPSQHSGSMLSWYVGNANALCSRPEKTARPAPTVTVSVNRMGPCSMEIVNATVIIYIGRLVFRGRRRGEPIRRRARYRRVLDS